eukprot:13693392-Alexandrium_andersonii.AAC.1
MSASLVGSEMCIRDRGDKLELRAYAGRLLFVKRRSGLEKRRALAQAASACLLYTSDAADDM